jgi:hypothetical protein
VSDRESAVALTPEESRFCVAADTALAAADVVCSVTVDASLSGPTGPESQLVCWTRSASGLVVEASGLRADVAAIGPRRYAASARIEPGPEAARALLRGVGAAVLEQAGGLTLHGAGVVVDGLAIVFLGPSGAGKSTAARLTESARSFADDHVALVPGPSGWIAWGLPGGTPSGMPASESAVCPLAALLRVRRGGMQPTIASLVGAEALFAIRAAVECGDASPDAEAARLGAAARLARDVFVGSVHTVSGHALTPRTLGEAWRRSRGHPPITRSGGSVAP